MKILILGLVLISTQAFAQRMTRIKADLRCGVAGGEVAIKLPSSSPARVWQTDPGEASGIELKVKEFKQARCPGCFSFTGNMMGIEVRGSVSSYKLTYDMYNDGLGKWENLLNKVKCYEVQKP